MRNPCRRGCPDRRAGTKDHPSCHSNCAAYLAYWEENRRENERRIADNKVTGFAIRSRARGRKIMATSQERKNNQ